MPKPKTQTDGADATVPDAVAGADPGDWPSFTESGAGLYDADGFEDDLLAAPIEMPPPQPFRLSREIRRHPLLYIGLGAAVATGLALYLGRNAIGRSARPIVVKTVRPVVIRAAARRPVQAARLAARHPRAAARLFSALR